MSQAITHPSIAVADPGFPVGGHGPHRGGIDSQGSYVLKICMSK